MPPLVVNQSNSALITNKNQMYSDKNLHLHAGFGYMSKNCFIAYFSCHLHSFMFYKRLLEQKLISCLESTNPFARLGQFSGKEDGDSRDCLFVKCGYYLCQAPFEISGFWITDGHVKKCFLSQYKSGKLK